MSTQCPLCDSLQTKRYGTTANGSRKYCCEVCNNVFTDTAESNLCLPEINFLRFKKNLLIKRLLVKQNRQIKRIQIITKSTSQKINQAAKFCSNQLLILALALINFLISDIPKLIANRQKYQRKIWLLFCDRKKHKTEGESQNIIYHTLNKWKSLYKWGIIGFLSAILIYGFMCIWLKIDINEPQPFDSYTLQALAWRSGHLELSKNYNWLELAIYKGNYYVSFPPVPTIPMLFLSFFFGEKTPSNWLMILCFFSSYWISYKLLRNLKNDDFNSAIWSAFLICGSSYLDISLFGWVWYMAQSMSFVLTLSCLLCLTYPSRKTQGIGLFCFALALGCRPLQAVYTPLLIGLILIKNKKRNLWQTLKSIIPMFIAPSVIVIALATLNYLRFDSIFEFGHNYLPVLVKEPQFSLSYLSQNFMRIFTVFPSINGLGQLELPRFGGFAFYIANPIFIILILRLVFNKNQNKINWLLFIFVAIHLFVLMLHITFGAWQFGTRLLVDILPFALVICVRNHQPVKGYEMLIILFALAFNMYGGIVFRTT